MRKLALVLVTWGSSLARARESRPPPMPRKSVRDTPTSPSRQSATARPSPCRAFAARRCCYPVRFLVNRLPRARAGLARSDPRVGQEGATGSAGRHPRAACRPLPLVCPVETFRLAGPSRPDQPSGGAGCPDHRRDRRTRHRSRRSGHGQRRSRPSSLTRLSRTMHQFVLHCRPVPPTWIRFSGRPKRVPEPRHGVWPATP